jgi:cysteine desulfurase/selenocysteine lyase
VTEFPVEALRADTPGCAEVVHLNNAGSSLSPNAVVDRVVDHLRLEARIGGYEAADQAGDEVSDVYLALGRLIGAHADEIALVDSATRAWLAAFTALEFRPGDRILTTRAEYSSNIIAMMAAARRWGVTIEVLPSTETGEASLEALAETLDDDVRLVAVTHAPTNGGLLEPVQQIGELVADHPALFLVDACQSLGQVPIDVRALRIDILTATGRKYLRAPRGTGFLFIRDGLSDAEEPVHIDLHSAAVEGESYRVREDARRFELWERNVAAVLGLGAAARYYAAVGIDASWQRIQALGDQLRSELRGLPDVTVLDLGTLKSGIVSFRVGNMAPSDVVEKLRAQHINVTVSRAPSTPWDMHARDLEAVNRASVHYYNDEGDVLALVRALRSLSH